MKTQVLAVRLPQDQFEILQKMADSRGLKISELAKEMLSAGIDGRRTGAGDSAEVLQRLEQLETNLLGAQTWLADAVITDIKATAAARYYARLGAENTDEVISYLANNQPLEPKVKAQWQKSREVEEIKQGEKWVQQAINIGSGK
ncbi:MAG: hypothetical protein B7Z80_08925 [Rhodospirillales bacterium 20-64-7]|nr:MAG: hypothetical protein B7Z80_08925 [Rhodospirillales bacterium 20-64-7]